MYQLFFFTDLWKQLLECFLVLYETLQRDDTAKIRALDSRSSPSVAERRSSRTYSICAGALSLLQAGALAERL